MSTLCIVAAALQAAPDAYESFDHTAAASLATQNGGTGFSNACSIDSGSSATITSIGSTYTDMTLAGNKVSSDSTSGAATLTAFRTLNTAYSTGMVYVSFLTQKTNSGSRFFGLSLYDSYTERALIGQSSTYDKWGIASYGVVASVNNSTIDATTLSLLVIRIDFNASGDEEAFFYVNPITAIEPSSAIATFTMEIGSFDRIRLGAGFQWKLNKRLGHD